MRELLIISGKGGTGKTSLTSAFAHLACGALICDLDVDAPDLHLLLQPSRQEAHDFHSGFEASIMPDRCQVCGICGEMCRFDAIETDGQYPHINPLKCEGCKVCVQFCPEDAIAFTSKHCGTWYQSGTRFGTLLHAQLFPGEENSGRLVALLRQRAKDVARAEGVPLILSDGPPGIGCPVISAVSGVHLAVIVTEPTPSGLHDMERIVGLCDHFGIPAAVIVNKSDLNMRITQRIRSVCRQKGYAVVGELPHDTVFVEAMVAGRAVTEYSDGAVSRAVEDVWRRIAHLAGLDGRAGVTVADAESA